MPRRHKTERLFIKSGGKNIFVQIEYPEGKLPRPAIVVAHGLRSFFPGFLDIFAKALRKAGYVTVKFHFLGTGKSDGNFEDKSTAAMFRNYKDVITYLKTREEFRGIGIMARSNAAALSFVMGPDPDIKAYVMLAPPAFYSKCMRQYTDHATEIRDGFFYHNSFKRPHTNGPGRLPLSFVDEIKRFDAPLLRNIPKLRNIAFFQSEADEAVPIREGHYDYFKRHLHKSGRFFYYKGGNHSFKGFKRVVIADAIRWFKEKLPVT